RAGEFGGETDFRSGDVALRPVCLRGGLLHGAIAVLVGAQGTVAVFTSESMRRWAEGRNDSPWVQATKMRVPALKRMTSAEPGSLSSASRPVPARRVPGNGPVRAAEVTVLKSLNSGAMTAGVRWTPSWIVVAPGTIQMLTYPSADLRSKEPSE